jgi:hypothetical protein
MARKKLFGLLLVVLGVALGIAILVPPEVAAQSCSLCYQSAAACSPRAIQALRNGILILIFPPAFICLGVTWLAWRRRELHNQGW